MVASESFSHSIQHISMYPVLNFQNIYTRQIFLKNQQLFINNRQKRARGLRQQFAKLPQRKHIRTPSRDRPLPASQMQFQVDIFCHKKNIINGSKCPDQPISKRANGYLPRGQKASPFTRGFSHLQVPQLMAPCSRDTNQHHHPVLLASHFVICIQSLTKFLYLMPQSFQLKNLSPKQDQRCGDGYTCRPHLKAAALATSSLCNPGQNI